MFVGITGKARSGKDTFAEMLAEEFYQLNRQQFILMAYANELKMRCQKDFDLSWEQLWGDDKEMYDKRYPKDRHNYLAGRRDADEIKDNYWTAREILQFIGTECYRAVDNDFWTKNLFRVAEEKEYNNVIVTDVRFPNEARPIQERGGVVIKVVSERSNKTSIHNEQHSSETAMDDYQVDITVRNDHTLKELREKAKEVALLILEQGRKHDG